MIQLPAPKISPKKLGIVAFVIAGAMFVVELVWLPVFSLPMGTWRFSVYALIAIYGALQLFLWYATTERIPLPAEEISAWGEKLEAATPLIAELYSKAEHSRDIAAAVEAKYAIPPEITLRYIIEVAKYLQSESAQGDE